MVYFGIIMLINPEYTIWVFTAMHIIPKYDFAAVEGDGSMNMYRCVRHTNSFVDSLVWNVDNSYLFIHILQLLQDFRSKGGIQTRGYYTLEKVRDSCYYAEG